MISFLASLKFKLISPWNGLRKVAMKIGKAKQMIDGKINISIKPNEETLLPMFKRKIISYVSQKQILENYKKNKESLNL